MLKFAKFHGTGNDFIMLDGRDLKSLPSSDEISYMCNRHTGIGADGLIAIRPAEGFDFEMVYFNSDGSLATMCGNGARCAAAFGHLAGMSGTVFSFLAGDGPHTGTLEQQADNRWLVEISMSDIAIPDETGERTAINTGTPHLVVISDDPDSVDVFSEGQRIRYSPPYAEKGINVNFVALGDDLLKVRTYEKGVEDETLSCGTGVTACAAIATLKTGREAWKIETRGGMLEVSMTKKADKLTSVRLKGPAIRVFSGEIPYPEKV